MRANKKNMINDQGYDILHLLYILLFKRLSICKKCIENELSKYEWLHRNLFAKYEDYRINERANPIMYE